MKLILFDVDGILVKTGTIKFDYWKAAIKKHFDIDTDRKSVYTEGKTDREILDELLKQKGIKEPENDKRFFEALNDIGSITALAIKNENLELEKIQNVEELIKKLIRERQAIGLLTGNTPGKAKAKLESAGLWKYFKIGAFGDATRKRSELVPIALKDAKQKTGIEFKKDDTYIIGDTIRDVRCAKEAEVKSIAVATGNESIEQLKKEKPDNLFCDFSSIDKIMAVIK